MSSWAPPRAVEGAPRAGLGVPGRRETFPLAFLCPPRVRRGRMALYAYCRLVDDIGDELAGDRLAALDTAERELRAAAAGQASHPVFVALQPVLAAGMLLHPLLSPLHAHRPDQPAASHATR